MTTTKRGRGRPADTSIYREGDHAKLARMADLINAAPELKPDTAMGRIGVHDEAMRRRLRRRWGRYKVEHLAGAERRLQDRRRQLEAADQPRVRVPNHAPQDVMGSVGDVWRLMEAHRAFGATNQLGSTISALDAMSMFRVADQLKPYQSTAERMGVSRLAADLMGQRPDITAFERLMTPGPGHAALQKAMGLGPENEALRRLYSPGGALDVLRPGVTIADIGYATGLAGALVKRKP